MFRLFKKKPVPTGRDKRILSLLQISDALTSAVADAYTDQDEYNPAELRMFSICAISVYVQAYGDLPDKIMKEVVEKFVEQECAMLLLKMPKLDYSVVHNKFIERFAEYADLTIDVTNASNTGELQGSVLSLVNVIDRNLRIQRGAFEAAICSLKLVIPLQRCTLEVRDALAR